MSKFSDWLKDLFSSLIRIFLKFIKDAFDRSSKLLIAEFKEFAISTVVTLASTDLTNEEKRAQAFKQIKEEAITRGKELGDSVANVLVELAVQYMKNNR